MNWAPEPASFRRTLGHYPTGVCAVTAMQAGGAPAGMVVGSFTSVSLEPPLVGFFPDRAPTSWPKISAAGRFCVNVLAENQLALCKALASKAEDKFKDIPYTLSETGQPILEGVAAWIDCDLYAIHEAGDHFVALGKVIALIAEASRDQLIFHKVGYGRFAALDSALV
ncbi:MAG: flavin reductase family protein [Caulobacterales bacterium]